MKYTAKQMAKELGISRRAVSQRLQNINIKGKQQSKQVYYTADDFQRIKTKKQIYNFGYRNSEARFYGMKTLIVEEYLANPFDSFSSLSRHIRISRETISQVIDEYKKNDNCIILQSKLNYVTFKAK